MDYLILFIIFLVIYLINRVRKSTYGDNIELDVTWFTGVNVNGVVKQWKLLVIDDEGVENTLNTDDPEHLKDNILVKLTLNNIKQSKFYKIIITYDTKSLRDINFISFYKYNKSNRYEDFTKTDFEDCYEYGNWGTEDSCCSTSGTKKYYQDTFGTCSADQIFKTVDCCYKTEWVGDNTCESDGKIRQTREAVGSCNDLSTERTFDCCYQTEWVNSGSCKSDGKQTQMRTSVGPCTDTSITREIDCCYQTEWVNSGSCSSEGKQLQIREVAGNCDDMTTEREIDCNFYGPWTMTDKCSSNGKITEERTVTRGGNVTKEEQEGTQECCYQTGWVNSGSCKSDGKQTQVRTSAGPCTDTSTTREIDCCYQTVWSDLKCESDGKMRQRREAAGNCNDLSTVKTTGDCCYQSGWTGTCSNEIFTQTREIGGTCSGEDAYTKRTANVGECRYFWPQTISTSNKCGWRYGKCEKGCCKNGECGSDCTKYSWEHDYTRYNAPDFTYE